MNENTDKENCTLCAAYDMFKTLKGLNFEDDDAFHLAAKQLIDMTVESIYGTNEEFYEDDDDDFDIDDMDDDDFIDLYDLDDDEIEAIEAIDKIEDEIFSAGCVEGYKDAVNDIFLIIKSYRESLGVTDDE